VASPGRDRPTLTLYARVGKGEVALRRWPTTIGGWKTIEGSQAPAEVQSRAEDGLPRPEIPHSIELCIALPHSIELCTCTGARFVVPEAELIKAGEPGHGAGGTRCRRRRFGSRSKAGCRPYAE
jgi:hypothetical protein